MRSEHASSEHPYDEEIEQFVEPVGYDFGFTRRSFVQMLGAGIPDLVQAGAIAQTQPAELANPSGEPASSGRGGRGGGAVPLDARLHVAKNGTITVLSGKVEGGQGARTEIAQAAAEELGVPLDQVRVMLADTDVTPDDGGTFGSQTTPRTIPTIREACAAARKLFDDFASHSADGKKLTYADLASDEKFIDAAKADAPRDVNADLDRRLENPGHARQPTQCPRLGHRCAPIPLRSHLARHALRQDPSSRRRTAQRSKQIDLAKAKAMKDVVVVRDGDFVGVAAPTTMQAKRLAALGTNRAVGFSRASIEQDAFGLPAQERTEAGAKSVRTIRRILDAAKSTTRSRGHLRTSPYVQHAPMEPRAAVAQWEDGKLTVWTAHAESDRTCGENLAGRFTSPTTTSA